MRALQSAVLSPRHSTIVPHGERRHAHSRGSGPRALWLALVIALVALVATPSASALIIRGAHGRHVGVLPRSGSTVRMRALAVATVGSTRRHRRSRPASPARHGARAWPQSVPLARASVLNPGDPLVYHTGGPVLGAHHTYAIYWDPSGQQPFPAGYQTQLNQYLGDVSADSGGHQNVFSVAAQYGVGTGHGVYSSTFAGMLADTNPYPLDQAHGNGRGCAAATAPAGDPVYGYCLTDAQIQGELLNLITQNGWPTGLGAVYFVFLPPGVDQCMGAGARSASNACSDKDYCAYHDATGPQPTLGSALYGVIPYADVSGCRSGQSPNGTGGDSPADDTASIVSHEHTETITDPLLSSWFDINGNEIGDKCEFDFGNALGGATGSQYNQVINGHHYYLQQEWSNATHTCAQRDLQAQFSASAVGGAAPGTYAFDGGASQPAGGITNYAWNFGDGTGTSSPNSTATHTYAQPGAYIATLTITDAAGNTTTASQQISATAPTAAFSISFSPGFVGQSIGFDASSSSGPSAISSFTWSFGDGTSPISSSAPRINHFFQQAGNYAVTLTVRDVQGNTASVTHNEAIQAPVSGSNPGNPRSSSLPGALGSASPAERAAGVSLAHVGSAQLVLSRGHLILITGRALACLAAAETCTVTVSVTAQQLTNSASTAAHRHRLLRSVAIATATLSAAPGARTLILLRLNVHGAALLRRLGRLAVSLQLQARAGQGHPIRQALSTILRTPRAHGRRR